MHPVGRNWRITQPFLQKDDFTRLTYRSGVHFGVDYACPVGTPVYAPLDIIVTSVVSNNPTMGNAILFECTNDGELTSHRFLHLNDILCTVGPVKQGALIGHTGKTGKGARAHLHWDIMKGKFVFQNLLSESSVRDTMIDPVEWINHITSSEKLSPLDMFSTEQLVDEIITRSGYKDILLSKIPS